MMLKTCEICGGVFRAKRHDARYCSGRCRMRKLRASAGQAVEYDPEAAARPAYRLTVDEMAEVVSCAHGLVSDLSRAAMCAPSPMDGRLSRVSAGLADLLTEEGL